MSQHKAQVSWQREEQKFTDNKYSRKHLWQFDGGAQVLASSAPSSVPVPMSDESAIDPEEALVAALSSCHMLWFLGLAAKAGFCVDSYIDNAVGEMTKNSEGKVAITKITIKPQAIFSGEKIPNNLEIKTLHHDAHGRCYIANSIKSEIVCEPIF